MVTLRGALVWRDVDGQRGDLRLPSRSQAAVDAHDCTVYPALVNAHDHLELNHYPRTRYRERYASAHDWGEDINVRLASEPFRSLQAFRLEDRCFIGGLKNLLCGALTVVHHNPPHRCLFRRGFPVRVVRRYGWAHSLHFTPHDDIRRSFRRTSPHIAWYIHLAEGTDATAAQEYKQLKALGCVQANTMLVHGVGLSDEDIIDAAPRIRGLVWCPSTNAYLLGTRAPVEKWRAAGGHILLGSDSRLTADGDLLDELRATQLRLRDVARWPSDRSAPMDDVILVRSEPEARADLALVVRSGIPQIGDPDLMEQFHDVPSVPVTLDGAPKRMHHALAVRVARCAIAEPGLELDPDFVRSVRTAAGNLAR